MRNHVVVLFSIVLLIASPAHAAFLFFNGTGTNVPIPSDWGSRLSGDQTGIHIKSGATPNVSLAWNCQSGAQWQFFNDANWDAAQMNGLVEGKACSITFTPDSGYGVNLRSFRFVDYPSWNDGSSFTWELREENASGAILATGTEVTADGEKPLLFTGMDKYHFGPIHLRITGNAGNDGDDEAIDHVSFTQIAAGDRWDGGGNNSNTSNPDNWSDNSSRNVDDTLNIHHSEEAIIWDSPTTVANMNLKTGFKGSVTTLPSTDLSISGGLTVGVGKFVTDSVISVGTYTHNIFGELQLILDSKTSGEYGRITASSMNITAGDLKVINDGLTLSEGDTFKILDSGVAVSGVFDELFLPLLDITLKWDTSNLYSTGEITVVATGANANSFITVWAVGDNDNLQLPLMSGGNYNFTVDYGDGSAPVTVTSDTDPDSNHTYANAGIYTVVIDGVLEGFSFEPTTEHADKLIDIRNWGTVRISYDGYNAGTFFNDTFNLTRITANDVPDMTYTTHMDWAFSDSGIVEINNVNNWNMSGVIDMHDMFEGAASFNSDISGWDVSNVVDMREMFLDATSFNQNIGGWNVASVTDMNNMFQRASAFNQNISGWNVSAVKTMMSMFSQNSGFNQDVSGWDVSSVTSFQNMFLDAIQFNQNLGSWNVESGANFEGMLTHSGLSTYHYDQLLLGWVQRSLRKNMILGVNELTHSETSSVLSAVTELTTGGAGGNGWTLAGGVGVPPSANWDGGADNNNFSAKENWDHDRGISIDWGVTLDAGVDSINWDHPSQLASLTLDAGFSGSLSTQPGVNKTISGALTLNSGGFLTDEEVSVGSLTQGANASLHLILDSKIHGEYGRVNVSGTLSTGGPLTVMNSGLSFALNDSFILFNGTPPSTFSKVNLPELSGGLGWDQSALYTTGTITVANASVAAIPDSPLSESGLDLNSVTLVLTNHTFTDTSLDSANFILNNAPPGLTIQNILYTNSSEAVVQLAFDGTDFDVAVSDFSVTILATELSGATDFTTNSVPIAAQVESVVANPDQAMTEDNLNDRSIQLSLSADSFVDNSLLDSNFMLIGAPLGTTIEAVNYIDSVTATVDLAFDGTDFDNDFNGFSILVDADELNGGSDLITIGLTVTANDDLESIAISDDGQILEGAEAGEVITVALTGGTYAGSLNGDNWVVSNLPEGVTKGTVLRLNNTTAVISLSGNTTTDYDTDISNIQVEVPTSDFSDSSGGPALIASTGVTFTAAIESTDFITTWTTLTPGESITLPLINGGNYDFLVDYGDGTGSHEVTDWNDPDATHTYPSSGSYTVIISGTLEGFAFNDGLVDTIFNGVSKNKIIEVSQWGSMRMSFSGYSGGNFFRGTTNLDITATDAPDMTYVTSLANAFRDSGIDDSGNLNSWDVSQVLDMKNLFNGATAFNQNIGSWNVSQVTTMRSMFSGTSSFNQDISAWNVSAVTTMFGMFRNSAFNSDISGWNVGSVTTMRYMFQGNTLFNQNIGSWNVSSLVIMRNMFDGATAFNQNIGSWNVSNVGNMESAFLGASSFNQNLNSWNVSQVTDMSLMFANAPQYNQPMNNWNVSSAKAMGGMFHGATLFDQDISGWNVSAVTTMQDMFHDATAFNQDLSGWDVSSVSNMNDMLKGVSLSRDHYDQLLIQWDALELQNGLNFNAGNSYYTADGPAAVARDNIIAAHLWSITDLGEVIPTGIWDSGAGDGLLSSASNWDTDEAPDNLWALIIDSGLEAITWDSPTTLSSLSLEGAYTGVVTAQSNTDLTVSHNLTVAEGQLTTDALLTTKDYTQGVNGELELVLDDSVGNQYGRLEASGDVTLSGTLTISEIITEAAGQSFTVLSWGTLSGTFDSLNLPVLTAGLTWDSSALYSTGVLSVVAQSLTGTPDAPLDETTLNDRSLVIDLVNVNFVDTTLLETNFILNNAPDGMTVESVDFNSLTQATVHFAYDGTDFDSDVTNFSITVSGAELTSVADLTLADQTITALADSESITISGDGGIVEGVEDGELITVTLSGGTYIGTLNPDNWSVANLPTGVLKGTVDRLSNTTATIALSGNSTDDYDSDIMNVSVTVSTAEFVDSTSDADLVATSGVVLTAVNENVTATPDLAMDESNLDARSLNIVLTGDTFVDSVLVNSNFTLNNAPDGTTVENVIYQSSTEAEVMLAFDGTDFDVNIANFNVTVAAAELSSGTDLTTGVNTITALNDPESITLTFDGGIQEGSESGELITVNLTGGTFSNPLNSANWSLDNLPMGVTRGAVSRLSANTATVELSGNATVDYDSDITNLQVTFSVDEYSDSVGDAALGASSGVVLTANPDGESIVISDDGLITEGQEDGEIITVTLTGGQFVTSLNSDNWTFTGLPVGVSIGGVNRVSDTLATVTLSGDTTSNYDTDITIAQLSISTAEFTDSTGDVALVDTGIRFTAVAESVTASPDTAMTESNLGDRSLTITVVGDSFVDSTLESSHFILNNAPSGTSVESVTHLSPTLATLNLDFIGTDFDASVTNFNVTVAAAELARGIPLTTGDLSITALADPESITLADDGNITEGTESGELITVSITGGQFTDSLTQANWVLTNLPAGVTQGVVSRTDNTTATIPLVNNSSGDYDTDITNLTLTIATSEFTDSSGDLSLTANSGVTFNAVNEDVTATPDSSMTESNLNDRTITIDILGDTFSDATLDPLNFTLNNAPQGTSVANVTYNSTTQAVVDLDFDGTDFDTDRPNFNISIAAAELSMGSTLTTSVNTITAVDDSESISLSQAGPISEGAENGELITVTLSNGQFVDSVNDTNWTVTNLPSGVTKGALSRLNDTQVTIALTGNSTLDYDSDITDVTVTLTSDEFHDSNGMSQLSASSGVTLTALSESSDFISRWTTTTDNEAITLPLINGGNYNFLVDYGDGSGAHSVTTWNDVDATHLYAAAGTYTVTISGTLEGFAFKNGLVDAMGNGISKDHINEISQWGGMRLSYSGYTGGEYFHGASNLDITAADSPDMTYTTSLYRAFKGSGIDDSGNLNSWDVSLVNDMRGLFTSAHRFNQPLASWNVSNVTSMEAMFIGAQAFNQDINGWNVANVTSMHLMFNSANAFNRNINSWNVQNVTDMRGMFLDNTIFNQDISDWNVASVTLMSEMFRGATAFDQDISGWNVQAVTDMTDMFAGATLSTLNYDRLLMSWDALELQDSINFNGGNSTYSAGTLAASARLNIINVDSWTFVDGGAVTTSAVWDSGGAEKYFSRGLNWDDDNGVSLAWDVTINSSGDTILWDKPAHLSSITLDTGFTGTVELPGTNDMNVDTVTVNAGKFSVDVTINTDNLVLGSGGRLTLHLDGFLPSEYGRIVATGTISLLGELEIIGNRGGVQAGDQFDLFDGSISGTLSNTILPTLTGGLVWDTSQLMTTGVIRVINPAATFDAGGADNRFSTATNWGGDVAPQDQWGVVVNLTSSDTLIWDTPATLVNLTLEGGFTGTVETQADVNRSVSQVLMVNSGTLSTDAVISTTDYNQGASGNLILTLDAKTNGDYGRINAGSGLSLAGGLTVVNDGLTFVSGDQFDLFNGPISGTFSSVTLPTLPIGLVWDRRDLYTTGVIRVQQPLMLTVDTQHGLTVDLRLHGSMNRVRIDWGDGTPLEVVTAEGVLSHTYTTVGTFNVLVGGDYSGFGWQTARPVSAHVAPITGVVQWNYYDGTPTITDLSAAFADHVNLTTVPSSLTSSVTNLDMLFLRANNFNMDISAWNVSNVTSMKMMFREATAFNGDISGWNMANVTTTYGMFREAMSFNQVIGSWNLSSVTDMRWMFYDADAFNQDISSWNVAGVTDMANMFLRAGLSLTNYDALLNGWSQQAVQSGVSFHGGDATYTSGGAAEVARNSLISTHGWIIKDGGPGTEAMRWEAGSSNLSEMSAFSTAGLPLDLSEVVIDSSSETIIWDSPTTLHQLTLNNGFSGTLQARADTNLSVTTGLWVNAGHLMTDALITTADYMQGVKGALTLVIDSKVDGQYGRIQATDLVRFSGQLNVVGEGVSFASGDRFDLFNGNTFMGSFASISLPALTNGLFWNLDALYTDGVISVDLIARAAFAREAMGSDESANPTSERDDSSSVWQLPSINRTVSGDSAPAPAPTEVMALDPGYLPITHLNPQANYEPGQHTLYWRMRSQSGEEQIAAITYNVYPEIRLHHSAEVVLEGSVDELQVSLSSQSPHYPITVELTVLGTATAGLDHSLSSNRFEMSGAEVIRIPFVNQNDQSVERTETVIVEVVATSSDGYRWSGESIEWQIEDTDSAPELRLTAYQQDHETFTIAREAGPMTLQASMSGTAHAGEINLDWHIPSALMLLSSDNSSSRQIDPSDVVPGIYTVTVTASNAEGDLATTNLNLRVTEGDRVNTEIVDSDADYLLDGHDQSDEAHLLQLFWGASDRHFLETTEGQALALGVEAMAVEAAGAMISRDSVRPLFEASVLVHNDSHTELYSAPVESEQQPFYSLEVHDLAFVGDQVAVTLPLQETLQSDATLLIYADGGWQEFRWSDQDQLYSIDSGGDLCPAVDETLYDEGVWAGSDCLLLTVTDGGVNDRDRTRDGKVALFFTILPSNSNAENSFRDVNGAEEAPEEEAGSFGGGFILLLLGHYLLRRKWRASYRK